MTDLLLDTNVISETRRKHRSRNFEVWWDQVEDTELFISVLSLGEIERGVERMRKRDPSQAAALADWNDGLRRLFHRRVLPISEEVAMRWGKLGADRPRPDIDTLIAATAIEHDMTLVTRNVRDFAGLDLLVLDPFNED